MAQKDATGRNMDSGNDVFAGREILETVRATAVRIDALHGVSG